MAQKLDGQGEETRRRKRRNWSIKEEEAGDRVVSNYKYDTLKYK